MLQDGCVVTHSVVGPRVTLQSGAKVTEGSVLGPDVIIDASKHIANLRLQASPSEDGRLTIKQNYDLNQL